MFDLIQITAASGWKVAKKRSRKFRSSKLFAPIKAFFKALSKLGRGGKKTGGDKTEEAAELEAATALYT